MIYIVQAGDTLSQIASAHGDSLSAVEAANPSLSDPNVIYAGEQVVIPTGGSLSSWTPSPGASSPSQSASSSSSYSQPSSENSDGSLSDVPGMPSSLASCIAFRESTNDTNPAADGNAYGIIPASGYNVSGDSLAQQQQVAGELYAQYGASPWAADGCPGT